MICRDCGKEITKEPAAMAGGGFICDECYTHTFGPKTCPNCGVAQDIIEVEGEWVGCFNCGWLVTLGNEFDETPEGAIDLICE